MLLYGKKVNQWIFQKLKLVDAVNEYMYLYEYQRSRSFIDLCDSTFSNFFSSETTGPIKVKFDLELLWNRGTKV